MTDEKSILEQFAAGNHTAFRELFMRYHLKVRAGTREVRE